MTVLQLGLLEKSETPKPQNPKTPKPQNRFEKLNLNF